MKRNFIIDEEISLKNGNDILKTEVYANNLSDVISNTPKNRVFTIGLFGGWGTGKSSILKTVREKLETDEVKFITYDAWKYANDSFRRMFLLKVQEELKYDKTEEMQRFYQSETAEAEPKTHISNNYLFVIVLSLLIILVIINSIPIVPDDWKISLSSIFTLAGLLITVFNGVFQKLKIQISKPHLFAPEQFEKCFKEMISNAFKKDNCLEMIFKYIKVTPKSITGVEKLVIVIDNIDRCHTEMAYQLLTDIKTFLSDEKLNVIFVIPVDDEALKQNLFSKSNIEQDCNKEKEEFLRKFFNVTIRIKPHQSTELNAFAKELNRKYKLGYNDDTIALCSKEFATNPRRIIQLFNNLASELDLYSDEFAQKNESMICIVLILREEYYDFYKKVVNDANELKKYNPNEEKKENKEENEENNKRGKDISLSAFLRVAAPIIRNTKMPDLLHILTNSDAIFDNVPTDVKNNIASYNIEEVSKYLNNNQDSNDIVLDLIKKETKENLKSKSDAQIINSLEFISSLSSSINLPNTFLIEIDSLFKGYLFNNSYYVYIGGIDGSKLENLCHFASLLDANDLPELKDNIISNITSTNIDSQLTGDKVNEVLVKTALRKFKSREDCVRLNIFIGKLFKIVDIYQDIDYSQDQKEMFFTSDLINYYIEKITLGDNNETKNLLWLLKNKINIDGECYSKLIEKLNTIIGDTTNKNKDQILSFIKYVANFFMLIPDRAIINSQQMTTLNNKLLWCRAVNGKNTFILDEVKSEIESLHFLIDTIIKLYRIGDGYITDVQVIKMVSVDKSYTYSKLLELREHNFKLKPFANSIINDNDYETNPELLIPLIEFCILQKDENGVYALDDSKIKNKVISLCENISKPGISNLIEHLIKDDKIKTFFIDVIKTKDAKYINELPQSLLGLAISCFSKENSSQFENNEGYLSVVAIKGTDEQKTEIVKMMTENINKKRNLELTFSVLACIELKKTYNKDMLRGALQSYKDSNPNDNKVDDLIIRFQ